MFVEKAKILGITIFSHLNNYEQVKVICNKVNSKTSLLTRVAIYSRWNSNLYYSSSSFYHIMTTVDHYLWSWNQKQYRGWLIKNFNSSILRFLKINIFNLTAEEQYLRLRSIKIKPYVYRQFFHFCTFSYNFYKSSVLDLHAKLKYYVKTNSNTR